ncbi:ABC transporter ATP-binding protein [Microbacterium pseudoresistens]|uniref:Peptide/nickel transport system ATP-binding protein n=1 Tax=Microbacterium pseudoresistens TaxID=640634 RepID=A0A7Y9JMJ5_9MICO|nr:ABC transporter ATP-binding protein [Microbacterium pseudoresistens]NYD54096.1 peptide/nickel transport system ATP-binding protein [Microbacterium pseudoresistens]
MTDVAEIQDLRIAFATDGEPVQAVNGISLRAHAGEVVAIVGESGSGKTVTANALLGLLPETATMSGAVVVRSREGGETDVVHAGPAKLRAMRGRDAAMVFQEPSTALNPVYSVGWQIAEGLRAHGTISKKEARRRAVEILQRVGIPDAAQRVDDYPHQFSGGQKQRIVIAMALVLDAGLIIADEPTTALDVTVQAEILDLLRTCRDEFGATIVLITHNMGVVADLADRVVVMYRGDIVEEAPVLELFANPQQEYTRQLLAAVPHVGQGKSASDAVPSVIERAERDETSRAASEPASPSAPEGSLIVAERCEIGYPGRFGRGGVVAVKGVDFHVGPREVVGLVGESGSGKTTIGRAVVGLTQVMGGSLRVLGQEMNGVKTRQLGPLRPEVGFVFQDPATSFNPLLTIAECIAEPLVVHRRVSNAAEARRKVDALLDAVRLPTTFGDRYPHELSGGQRQRASLARALALDPKLLIADEPTSALDVSVQATVLELFVQLQAELGFASLFISHDLAVIDAVSDRIIVLQRGEIREQGTTAQVLNDPRDGYTKELLAALPVPDPVEQAERRALWQQVRRR